MGRQHQGMDRPGVRQVPEGSGEQGKMEKTGCKIICGATTTLAVKGLMMMMMMMHVQVSSTTTHCHNRDAIHNRESLHDFGCELDSRPTSPTHLTQAQV